ncbi:MAG: transposase, partial [Betaproteobacteria bacterium]|nr:transposase [Betaproteobacteria bacterium]
MTRFAGQQIIGFLNEAEAGIPVKELCRTHGFGDAAFCGWRSESGGLQVNEGRRLREPEFGNAKLKKRLAEAHLDVEALKVAFGAKTPAPQAKRQAVERMRQGLSISKCRAWGLAGLARTTMRREVAETAQNEALKVL